MRKPDQVVQSVMNNSDTHFMALAWNIATEPKIHQKLVSNPYTADSLQYISERFPNERPDDVIEAMILAEPEGPCDWNFQHLAPTEQAEETERQRVLSVQMQERLSRYIQANIGKLAHHTKDDVYTCLSFVVFETADEKHIQSSYFQSVRKSLRLHIIQVIADISPDAGNNHQSSEAHYSKNTASQRLGMMWIVVPELIILFLVSYFIYMAKYSIGKPQLARIQGVSYPNKQVLGSEKYSVMGLPVRLTIPKIHIDAAVQYVKTSPDGTMGVPDNIDDVGWYTPGPRPGERGSAVIAGHLNGTNGEAGVFADLHTLTSGDVISVQHDNGGVTTFRVRESGMYDPGYAEAVFSKNDGTYLNLITCDGLWDVAKKEYGKRLVVFADIEN